MSENPTTFEPRTAVVRIFGGDYLDQIRDLEFRAEAAREAEEATGPRLGHETPEYLRLAEEHDALVREAEAQAVDVKIRALGRTEWRQMVVKHPPRAEGSVSDEIHRRDVALGFDQESFADELVPSSVVSPEWARDPAALDTLSDVDFERLWLTALGLNKAVMADPKASLVSRLTQTSEETSN